MSGPSSSEAVCRRCGARVLFLAEAAFCPGCANEVSDGRGLGRRGPYSLETCLGEGGMGQVYLAFHETTGRAVALKVPRVSGEQREAFHRRFAQEARALSTLDHPGILPIYEVGEEQGEPYFAMKLAEGGNLAERIGGKPIPPREAAMLVAAVATAVQYVHDRGILHRDLKPHNILLDEEGRPMLGDFGLARWSERLAGQTLVGAELGTPDYTAPEVAAGQAPAAAADIFSLGAILYHLLSGEPPFQAASLAETLNRAARGDIRRLAGGDRQIPEELELICFHCLEREPADRYPSAAALAEDLQAWLEERPVSIRPLSHVEKLRRLVRRNPLVTVLSFAIAFVIASAAALLLASNRRVLHSEYLRAQAAANLSAERMSQERQAHIRLLLGSGLAGQRREALSLLREEWARHPDVELRSLAVRALALPDFTLSGTPPPPRDGHPPVPPREIVAPAGGRRAFIEGDDRMNLVIKDAKGNVEATCVMAAPVTVAAWNPAGDRLALGGSDKAGYLWRAGSNLVERQITTRDGETIRIAWHRDGQYAACSSLGSNRLSLWDTDGREDAVEGTYPVPDGSPLEWTADGSRVVFIDSRGKRQEVAVEFPSGFHLLRLPSAEPKRENFRTIQVDAGRERAVVVTDRGARLWNWRSGLTHIVTAKRSAEWLGARFVGGDLWSCGWDTGVRQFSSELLASHQTVPWQQSRYVGCVLLEVSADDQWIALLNRPANRFELIHPAGASGGINLPEEAPYWITFDARSTRAVTSSFEKDNVHVWRLPEGSLERTLPLHKAASVALSPNGRLLVTVGSGAATLWDVDGAHQRALLSTPEPPHMAAWSPDGACIGVQTRLAVYLFRAEDGALLSKLENPSPQPGDMHVALAFDGTQPVLAEQFDDGSLAIWDIARIRAELRKLGMDWE